MEKKCNMCAVVKPYTGFHKNGNKGDGYYSCCKECKNELKLKQRRTRKGQIGRCYENMVHSCNIRSKNDPHRSYEVLFTRKELIIKFENDTKYIELYNNWVESGYKKQYSPSFNRLNDYSNYTFDNIEINTWEFNESKAIKDKVNGINNKNNRAVSQYDLQGNYIKTYHSQQQASRETGIYASHINKCCKGIVTSAKGYVWKYSDINYKYQNDNSKV